LSKSAFDRVLGRADLLLFSVCAILTIDSLASAASMGVSWFSWWIITMVVFFLPYGLVTAELGAAWPGEGGIYIWVREAMGSRSRQPGRVVLLDQQLVLDGLRLHGVRATFYSIFLKQLVGEAFGAGRVRHGCRRGSQSCSRGSRWVSGWCGWIVSKWLPNLGAVVKARFSRAWAPSVCSRSFAGRPPQTCSRSDLVPR
jgi:amino acid transporter